MPAPVCLEDLHIQTKQKSQNPRYCQGSILVNHTDLGSNPAPAASGSVASGKLPALPEPS